jgi:LacI family transcriptional regulator
MVAEAIRLIWQQSQGPMTVDSLTRQLPTTRRSLERRFSAAIGHGIHDEIVHCRLERAKRLLVATDLSMKEIAAAAGFSGADSMGRTFGRIEGISPLQFRRQRPARQGS